MSRKKLKKQTKQSNQTKTFFLKATKSVGSTVVKGFNTTKEFVQTKFHKSEKQQNLEYLVNQMRREIKRLKKDGKI